MDNDSEIASSRLSTISGRDSASVIGKRRSRERHFGSGLEQKLNTLRALMLGQSLSDEQNYANEVPSTQPLKPMPYVRRFTVSVSLKKSRVLGFYFQF